MGCSWIVGAADDPPQFALPLQDAFVLVTKLSRASGAKPPPPVFASARTKRHILYDDPESDPAADPWLHGKDPWSIAQATVGSATKADTPMPAAVQTKWQAMENGLKKEVQSIVHQEIEAKGGDSQARPRRANCISVLVIPLVCEARSYIQPTGLRALQLLQRHSCQHSLSLPRATHCKG